MLFRSGKIRELPTNIFNSSMYLFLFYYFKKQVDLMFLRTTLLWSETLQKVGGIHSADRFLNRNATDYYEYLDKKEIEALPMKLVKECYDSEDMIKASTFQAYPIFDYRNLFLI